MGKKIVGIDFGTNAVKIYKKGAGIAMNEKNVIAIKGKKKVVATGNDAYVMLGKAPEQIEVTKPIRNGVIADIGKMQLLLDSLLEQLYNGKVKSSDYLIAVPMDITEVEKRAFFDLIQRSNAKSKNVFIVEKPLASALGMDIDIESTRGALCVDIGADTTEVAIISMEGIVLSKLIPIGGYKMDQLITSSVRRKHNLVIGDKTAENVKKELGFACNPENVSMRIFGRDLVSGLPSEVNVSSELVSDAIHEPLGSIVSAIRLILERTPPEISADIVNGGVYITGGSAHIKHLAEFIKDETRLDVNIVEDSEMSVVNGLGKIAENRKLLRLTSAVKR
ncbi:MAG: rod shape-determining protein [Lachnospiraceae bacterium]|nr:rod shape-determining protein [Lachnospiraceae bacterium]MCR4803888.1 rod shape-determining protein [Lachnospiraceae bacterium]